MSYGDIPFRILLDVEWKTIRSAFIRARGARKQDAIAIAGGLRQNAISKLESNDNLGPAVETFIKAIKGLGMPVSVFFAQIEGLPAPASVTSDQAHVSQVSTDDDELPSLTAEEVRTIRTFTKVIKIQSDREAASQRRTDRRHATKTRDEETPSDSGTRTNRQRNARQRKRRIAPRHK